MNLIGSDHCLLNYTCDLCREEQENTGVVAQFIHLLLLGWNQLLSAGTKWVCTLKYIKMLFSFHFFSCFAWLRELNWNHWHWCFFGYTFFCVLLQTNFVLLGTLSAQKTLFTLFVFCVMLLFVMTYFISKLKLKAGTVLSNISCMTILKYTMVY